MSDCQFDIFFNYLITTMATTAIKFYFTDYFAMYKGLAQAIVL